MEDADTPLVTPAPPSCPCGAGPHDQYEDRCSAGHVLRGNGAAVVTGVQSLAFWREHAAARQEIAHAIITDLGHAPADAPRALAIVADSIAQALLIRDAAYRYMAEAGGPLNPSGRPRRALRIWAETVDRLERQVRLVGLERRAKPAPTLADIIREQQQP